MRAFPVLLEPDHAREAADGIPTVIAYWFCSVRCRKAFPFSPTQQPTTMGIGSDVTAAKLTCDHCGSRLLT